MSDTPDVDVTLIPKSRQAVLPTPRPAALIHYADGTFTGAHPDTGIAASKTLHEILEQFEYYVFDASVYALGKRLNDVLLLPGPDGRGSYFHSPRTVEKTLQRVADAYSRAKDRYVEWLDNKTDLAVAWDFVAEHPAFWLVKKDFHQPTNPLVSVNSFGDGGAPLVLVENGPVIDVGETTDPFVTGEGATFEQALSEHAELIAARYHWDGEPLAVAPEQEG